MSNNMTSGLAWLGLIVQLAAAFAAPRSRHPLIILGTINLLIAGSVVVYWAIKWYSYLFRGIIWSASDQLLPLYAIVVVVLAVLALSGRMTSTAPLWVVLVIDSLGFLLAALVLTFFRMKLF